MISHTYIKMSHMMQTVGAAATAALLTSSYYDAQKILTNQEFQCLRNNRCEGVTGLTEQWLVSIMHTLANCAYNVGESVIAATPLRQTQVHQAIVSVMRSSDSIVLTYAVGGLLAYTLVGKMAAFSCCRSRRRRVHRYEEEYEQDSDGCGAPPEDSIATKQSDELRQYRSELLEESRLIAITLVAMIYQSITRARGAE